jgi:hypothetical protein
LTGNDIECNLPKPSCLNSVKLLHTSRLLCWQLFSATFCFRGTPCRVMAITAMVGH